MNHFSVLLRCGRRINLRSRTKKLLHPQTNLSTKIEHYSQSRFNKPKGSNVVPRPGGIASFMRLPVQELNTEGLTACFVGIPIDCGTSNRPGTRFGPRQIRTESAMLRPFNSPTGADPFNSIQVADIGDVFVDLYNINNAVKNISKQYSEIIRDSCIPLTMGGDHTITYPILQAIKDKYGPVAMIHVDAHDDLSPISLGNPIYHGSPFKRATEEQLIVPKKTVQIGIRGSSHSREYEGLQEGFRVVPATECWYKSLSPLMEEIRANIGDTPTYLTFDIDGIDPAFAPGTGTPEIGGLTTIQALEVIRGCRGLNIVGADLVEVSPPYDTSGNTSLAAAHLLFEMLCVLPGVKYD